jgi:hypothetical protein
MNTRKLTSYLIGALLSAAILLAACQPVAPTALPQPGETAAVAASPTPVSPTQAAAQPTQTSSAAPAQISLAFPAVAQSVTIETVPAVPAGDFVVGTEVMPQHTRLPLQGYPVTEHQLKPQIYIYPLGELATANETAGKVAADLKTLLETRQAGEQLPFLPLMFSVRQALDVQVQYLDFKSGKGVRYLTQFNNGMAPVNNKQLTYTFQGLTSDGRYYVAAVLPVTHPALPADSTGDGLVLDDYTSYLAQTIDMLEQQPADSFTPGLSVLDALVSSIELH